MSVCHLYRNLFNRHYAVYGLDWKVYNRIKVLGETYGMMSRRLTLERWLLIWKCKRLFIRRRDHTQQLQRDRYDDPSIVVVLLSIERFLNCHFTFPSFRTITNRLIFVTEVRLWLCSYRLCLPILARYPRLQIKYNPYHQSRCHVLELGNIKMVIDLTL